MWWIWNLLDRNLAAWIYCRDYFFDSSPSAQDVFENKFSNRLEVFGFDHDPFRIGSERALGVYYVPEPLAFGMSMVSMYTFRNKPLGVATVGGIIIFFVAHTWHSWQVRLYHLMSSSICGHQNLSLILICTVYVPLCPKSSCAWRINSNHFPSGTTILCLLCRSFLHSFISSMKNSEAYLVNFLRSFLGLEGRFCGFSKNFCTAANFLSSLTAFSVRGIAVGEEIWGGLPSNGGDSSYW